MEKYIQQVTHAEDISREKTKFLISLNLFLSEEDFIVNSKVCMHVCTVFAPVCVGCMCVTWIRVVL